MRAKSHRCAGNRLVASHHADHRIKQLAAAHQFDRIGNQFAADQRRAHALGAHGLAVGNRDGVELHRRAAGGANALLHFGRKPPQMKIAGMVSIHVLATPIRGLLRSASVKPMALNMAARAGAVAPVGDSAAAMFEIHD